MSRNDLALIIATASLGFLVVMLLRSPQRERHRSNATDSMEEAKARQVRNAGPGSMANPPREWSMVDEESDESFPASDVPGNY
ncbi:hypothetical protein JSE7799_03240 [Jannaschia seosinensis]|uniref:Uncharacterized protein n=1 Tax=Jannaschia seosinensis TaxID=313367 RepID=A0A0M7BGM8_9RHOB|nr:hypothetical protein [Jannaschia seosinensis]CUH40506.1 hypothetical protein JSE7799_03240 [Jannaschia seosinensis]